MTTTSAPVTTLTLHDFPGIWLPRDLTATEQDALATLPEAHPFWHPASGLDRLTVLSSVQHRGRFYALDRIDADAAGETMIGFLSNGYDSDCHDWTKAGDALAVRYQEAGPGHVAGEWDWCSFTLRATPES